MYFWHRLFNDHTWEFVDTTSLTDSEKSDVWIFWNTIANATSRYRCPICGDIKHKLECRSEFV